MEWVFRFLIGGSVVSAFALLGDVVRPKSFAGIFGAAPSVALATLALTIHSDGASYAATEARSMIAGAVSLMLYTSLCSRLLMRGSVSVKAITLGGLVIWLVAALIGWTLFLRGNS